MKIIFVLNIAMIMILASCSSIMKDEVKESIPGTYIRFSEHEFGTEYDTLIISLQNKTANEYKIVRKWKYERILDGKRIEPEYKTTGTTGVYESTNKLLHENETDDVYSFDVREKILFNGPVKYQKL